MYLFSLLFYLTCSFTGIIQTSGFGNPILLGTYLNLSDRPCFSCLRIIYHVLCYGIGHLSKWRPTVQLVVLGTPLRLTTIEGEAYPCRCTRILFLVMRLQITCLIIADSIIVCGTTSSSWRRDQLVFHNDCMILFLLEEVALFLLRGRLLKNLLDYVVVNLEVKDQENLLGKLLEKSM